MTKAGTATEQVRALGLEYPSEVFSLSHLALPFPLSDSLYGMQPESDEDFGVHLGAMATRGERGVLIITLDSLARMSSNPFFPYLMQRVEKGIEGAATVNKQTRWILLAFTLLIVAAALLLPAVPQPPDYHDFADKRDALGIDNFLDVVSNTAFLLAGAWGLVVVLGRRTRFEYPSERWPWLVFFVGIVLTAAGSSYYHLYPDNETLFWDRLPMTIAFMGLVSAQIVDRVNVRAGLLLLVPMLLVGVVSVVYWLRHRAARRRQCAALRAAAGLCGVRPVADGHPESRRATRARAICTSSSAGMCWPRCWKASTRSVLAYSHIVSGHTLKHVAAAAAGFLACWMLLKRQLRVPAVPLR